MALIKCPDCGKEISDKATACIHCGCPMEHYISNEVRIEDEPIINKSATDVKKTDSLSISIAETPTKKFYQKTWFIVLMLIFVFPVGIFLLWKYKKFNSIGRIIISVLFSLNFLFWLLVLLVPCQHDWVDATCTTPKYCELCGKTEGDAIGHIESDWTAVEEASLINNGVEELVCSVCGEVLDERSSDKKTPKIVNNTFNFTDEELIDWANDWLNDTYDIDDSGAFDLGSDILGYKVETKDGEDGMLLLKHDGGKEVSAIMVYFDDFVDRTALALFFGTKINKNFIYDDASKVLATDGTYFASDMIATNITLKKNMEVALLTPINYMGKILSGTNLTQSDCYVSIENNEERYAKYNNNMWEHILNEYGEGESSWFWIEDDGDFNIHEGLGEIKTYRGITLGVSTEEDIINAYGHDVEIPFNKNTDIIYRSMKESGVEYYKYLEDSKKVFAYDYNDRFQIVMYTDNEGIVDFILFSDGLWYVK